MKPAVPGVPMMPSPAITNAAKVSGILRPIPPRSASFTVPTRYNTAPSARNSAPFITA